MQFNNGVEPPTAIDKETIRAENETNRTWFNGQTGIYAYGERYYIIGKDVFLEYETLDAAKEDLFGEIELEEYEQNMNEEVTLMSLPGLPENFSDFTFPAANDELTEMYFDADLCYWFLDEGEIRKTLFSAVDEGEIPEVSYIVEFNKEFFIATPSEHSIEGRFPSVEAVLAVTEYGTMGREPYEEIDYFRVCYLDREANDEEVDYIADKGLYWWIKMHADFERSFDPEKGKRNGYFYDIYEFFDGYFVLDPNEKAVIGKYTTFVTASIGANDLYEERLEDEYEDEDED